MLQVNLFMDFSLAQDGETLSILRAKKVRELLAYLLLNSGRPHRRQFLMTLLWEDSDESKAQKYLRQALWQLQSELSPHMANEENKPLNLDSDWVQIQPQVGIWCDALEFLNTFRSLQGIAGQLLTADQVRTLQAAVALYRGDLLEGWYQDWCLIEREYLQNSYLIMLEKLMDNCETRGMFELGLEYGTFALKQDAARERTHRRLMRLYALLGDRSSALRQYERCVAALKKELDVSPAQSTRSLYDMIKRDELARPQSRATQQGAFPGKASGILIRHLQHVYANLGEIQELVQAEIDAVRRIYSSD